MGLTTDPTTIPAALRSYNDYEYRHIANLEDSFLADLEDLSDNDNENLDEDSDDAEHMEEDVNGDLADIEALNYDDLDSVSKLQKSQRYSDIMKKVEDALEKGSDMSNQGMVLEDDPEYQLIVECNTLSVDIENEIVIIHNFIRDKYRLKFPELESLVHHPIDYARVVKKIGNEVDLTVVDLEGLLPSAIIMVISVTASTTSGKPLPEDVLQKTIEACDRALTLDASKKKVLDFVESRMGYIAPNLSAIVGSAVAAKLMGTAGGLASLAKMPACNVQLLGAKKKALAGFSTATSQFRVGYIEQTEVFQTTPPALKMRACRLLAAKSTLAARVDSVRGDPSGSQGRTYRDDIRKKIEKWQEPPPAKQPKPLPVPDSEPKKKRGGRRLRKMKERYAITDMRKLANRMQFGIPEESSLGDGLGEGYGMLGQAGNGKLRVSVGQSKLAAKVAKKFKDKQYSSGGATSGLTSSLAFTPVQGIDLVDPQADANRLGSGTQSTYFSETGTFSKIHRT
ncbi:U4/U6 small nuclear ribonucleoprotein Prp31 [Tanacetum coccineum]